MKLKNHQNKESHIMRAVTGLSLIILIAISCWVMGLSPAYNGKQPDFRNIYEHLTDALAQGHFYLNIEPDPLLATLDNPYDPAQREAANVSYLHDASYYNGKYFCYFGPVPALLVMVPIKIITGITMPSYHVTQFAVAMICIGIFALFNLFRQCFFSQMSLQKCYFLSIVGCVVSVWYFVDFPAMYCVAISFAVALEVWSIYCFVCAVWKCSRMVASIRWAFLGALFGALSFGCRPTVALANILVVPMLATYLKKWWGKVDSKPQLVRGLFFAASPYLVVAVLLCMYNYFRFGNIMEFGMAYQLTTNDVKAAMHENTWESIICDTWVYFWKPIRYKTAFPYIEEYGGIFGNYPIFLLNTLGLVGMLKKRDVVTRCRQLGIGGMVGILYVLPIVIMALSAYCAIYIVQRYCTDVYWLMAILLFIMEGIFELSISPKWAIVNKIVLVILGMTAIMKSVLMLFVPFSDNFTMMNPELLQQLSHLFPSF